MRIAIDAMGGDNAPFASLAAVELAAREFPDDHFVVLGDIEILRTKIDSKLQNVEIVHASDVITADDEPVRAVRSKPNSSLVMSAMMVRERDADVMVSAGNTGALVAAGLLTIGRMRGIDRPALAPVLPTFDGQGVLLLDAGATMDAGATNLVQYAQMGEAYSRYILGVKEPRIALVNVGSEPGKGNAVVKEAYERLRGLTSIHFVGNVEGRELLDGRCDVAVCDGFVGNVVLKIIEGAGLGFFRILKDAMTATTVNKLAGAVLRPSFTKIRNRFDYAEYGGAPFLGVSGGCIKAHGSSGSRAWLTAIRNGVSFARQDMLAKISQSLTESSAPREDMKE